MIEKNYSASFPGPLRKKKIRNLIKCSGMLPHEAAMHWEKTRIHDGLKPRRRGKKRRA